MEDFNEMMKESVFSLRRVRRDQMKLNLVRKLLKQKETAAYYDQTTCEKFQIVVKRLISLLKFSKDLGLKFDIEKLDLSSFYYVVRTNLALAQQDNKVTMKKMFFEKLID